jgi:hypothetical protein
MPGPILNPFASDAFSMAMLTESMIRLPYNQYSLLGDMGLFTEEGVATTSVIVEEMGGSLNILPTIPRGAPIARQQHRAPSKFGVSQFRTTVSMT